MTTPANLPERMRAVVLDEYRADIFAAIRGLKIQERPVPRLRRGQVLVKVEAAPCNPSDLLLLQGKYGRLKKLPTVPGWEGAGTVVASGGGILAGWLKGKRVACALNEGNRDGTWAEYFAADPGSCVLLKSQVTFEQAASLIINPLSVMGLLWTARRDGHRAAVHTAAASQVGRMLLTVAAEDKFPIIHVVRRDKQAELLKSLGAKHVLSSASATFGDALTALCKDLGATAAFEAIGGDMTGVILNRMPRGSTVYVYGALSEEPCGNIDPIELIFNDKSVKSFFLGNWQQRRGMLGLFRATNRVQRMMIDGRLETKIQRQLALPEVVDGLQQYVDNMTEGKVLIMPGRAR